MLFTASKLPADLAGSGWYQTLPPPPAPRILDRDIRVDWVIIGAGFAGLSAARRIQEKSPSDTVAVLDAQPIAWGASGRNSGFFIDLPHHLQNHDYVSDLTADRKQIQRNRFAISYAKSMIDEFGLQSWSSSVGRINAATSQAGLDALLSYSRHLEKLGEPFTKYNEKELKAVIGSGYYSGGIHLPGCLLVQPAGYIRGIARGLCGEGNRTDIFENSPVIRIETGSPHRVRTPKGSVAADKVILTVNGHLESFGLFKRRLMHIFLYASMTRELAVREQRDLGGEPEWGITPAHAMGSTIRRTRDHRILVRNSITYNPQRETTRRLISAAGKRQEASFAARFPMLGKVGMEYRWSGHLCLARNSVPAFGEIEKGVYAAGCQNGLGATQGTLSGMLIVDHAVGDHHSMVRDLLQCAPPKKLFPEPFMSLGVNTRLWWGQRRAGGEL
ncbi:MAG: FAD-binding oxidoreductase [Gammaproteobacteria bacterium]|nr:FAD-binding oxidoreductase [Gammaproteobacteria bacterium]